METNYTLKKLIRGGTALLFLLAFMLTGTFSANAQDRGDVTLVLKIEGVGDVFVEVPGGSNYVINGPTPEGGSTITGGPFSFNTEGFRMTMQSPGNCYSLTGSAFTATGVTNEQHGTTTFTFDLTNIDAAVVTATFFKLPEPEVVIEDVGTVSGTDVCDNATLVFGIGTVTGTQVDIDWWIEAPDGSTLESGTQNDVATGLNTITYALDAAPKGTYVFYTELKDTFADGATCVVAGQSFTFTVVKPEIALDLPGADPEPILVCFGDELPIAGVVTTTSAGNATFTWEITNGSASPVSNGTVTDVTTGAVGIVTVTGNNPGTYTFAITSIYDASCQNTETLPSFTFKILPDFAFAFAGIEDGADFCADDTFSLTVGTFTPTAVAAGTLSFTWQVNKDIASVLSGTWVLGTSATKLFDQTDLDAGTYTLTVTDVLAEGGCGVVSPTDIGFTISPNNKFTLVSVDADPGIWDVDNNLIIKVGLVTPAHQLYVDYTIELPDGTTTSTSTYNVGSVSDTFVLGPFAETTLGIGQHTITMTIDDQVGCSVSELVGNFTIDPPIYAMFSPTYLGVRSVNHPSTTTWTTDPRYIIEGVPTNQVLTIEFSDNVVDASGNGLPVADIGDHILFQYWDDEDKVWVDMPFSSSRQGLVITIDGTLDGETYYRLGHSGVFIPTNGAAGPNVKWTLDAETITPTVTFDEENTANYWQARTIYFKTKTNCEETQPTITPEFAATGVDVCVDENLIRVDFVNPIKFLRGVKITNATSVKSKFKFEKKVSQDTKAPVEWEDVEGWYVKLYESDGTTEYDENSTEEGPSSIVFMTSPAQLSFDTQYRILQREFDWEDFDSDFDFGFIDIETGCNVLGEAEYALGNVFTEIHEDSPWFDFGWTWTTTNTFTYEVEVKAEPEVQRGFSLTDYNKVWVDLGSFNAGPELPVVGVTTDTATNTLLPQNITTTFTFDGTVTSTLTASAGEGYYFDEWEIIIGGSVVGTHTPTTLEVGPNLAYGCAPEEPHFVAKFVKNQYQIDLVDVTDAEGTLTGATSAKHGDVKTYTATPVAGKFVKSLVFNPATAPPAFAAVVPDPDDVDIVAVPGDAVGTVTFTGDSLVDGNTFTITATYNDFVPWVYAVAVGVDKAGVATDGFANIDFKTTNPANMESHFGFHFWSTDGFSYQKAQFVYGNPGIVPPFQHFPITLKPLDVPCEYEFIRWERWIVGTQTFTKVVDDDHFDLDGKLISFIPTENYRLRAIFEWREDVHVSAVDPTENATVVIFGDIVYDNDNNFVGFENILLDKNGAPLINNDIGAYFEPGDVIYIRSHPEPDYFTYGWYIVDAVGTRTDLTSSDIQLIARKNNRSYWEYTVTCDDVDLKADVDLKRYEIIAQAQVGEGHVFNSTPLFDFDNPVDPKFPSQYTGSSDGIGFVTSTASGYNQTSGEFVMFSDDIILEAEATGANLVFWYWQPSVGTLTVTANPWVWSVTGHEVTKNETYTAVFRDTTVHPTYNLMVYADPTDAGAFESSEVLGVVDNINETITVPATNTPTITVDAKEKPGYTFVDWTLVTPVTSTLPGIDGSTNSNLSFAMPGADVELQANYEKTVYAFNVLYRTYLRPHTETPYIINTVPGYGGFIDVTAPVGVQTVTYGDQVCITATANPGFRYVNTMLTDVRFGGVDDNQVLTGLQIEGSQGVNLAGVPKTFCYTIPRLPDPQGDTDIDIYVIFVEVGADPNEPPYPIYALTTGTNHPDNKGEVSGAGFYAHGVKAIVEHTGYDDCDGWVFDGFLAPAAQLNSDPNIGVVDMVSGDKEAIADYVRQVYDLDVSVYSSTPWGSIIEPVGGITYTMSGPPIPIAAQTTSDTNEYAYSFVGWYYVDAYGDITEPVVDDLGEHIVELEGFWIRQIPDDCEKVRIVAKFASEVRKFELILKTALNTFDNLNAAAGIAFTDEPAGLVSAIPPVYTYEYPHNTPLTIQANAAVGYEFKRFTTVTGQPLFFGQSFPHTFVADTTFIAVFEAKTSELAIEQVGQGTVADVGGDYDTGTEIGMSAVPAAGWELADHAWTYADGTPVPGGEAGIFTYTMEYNKDGAVPAKTTLRANFVQITHEITAEAGDGGTIAPDGVVVVNEGDDQSFHITPDTGYVIADVLVNDVSVGAVVSYTFANVMTDHTIEAIFAKDIYEVTATAGVGGTIDPAGVITVTHGEMIEFTITADVANGYQIKDVLVDGASIGAVGTYTTVVTDDFEIEAQFELITLTIEATAGVGGTITPAGDVEVTYGDDQIFMIAPATGYEIDDVLVDGVSVGKVVSYTFADVTEDHTIEAQFVLTTLHITATAGEGGSITPSGVVEVTYGEDQTFVIAPDDANIYEIDDVLVDGVSVGAIAEYTFEDVVTNHTIEATFKKVEYTITGVVAEGEGDIELSAGPYNYFDIVTASADADAGYAFVKFVVLPQGINLTSNPADFVVLGNHTVEVYFELITYDVTFNVVDEDGEAAVGAIVTLNGYTGVADEDGQVVFENVAPGDYEYSVALTGYNAWEDIELTVGAANVVENVAFLQKDAPDDVDFAVTAKTAFISTDAEYVMLVDKAGHEVDGLFIGLTPGETYEFTVVDTTDEAGYKILSAAYPGEFTTLALGDVDGDGFVTVDDAFHMIDYINGEEFIVVIETAADLLPDDDKDAHEGLNFILDAADMNNDDKINIVDIVLIVSEATGVAKTTMNSADADMYLTPGMIQLDSDGTLAGVQFELYGSNLEMLELESMIPGFTVNWRISGDVLTAMFVGFDSNVIERGMTDLIRVANADDIVWGHTFAVNRVGDVVDVTTHEGTTSIFDPSGDDITFNAFPNPSQGQFTTDINTATASNVALRLYDLSGRQISIKQLEVNGFESVSWDEDLTPGMYILRMVATPVGQAGESVTREIRIMINK